MPPDLEPRRSIDCFSSLWSHRFRKRPSHGTLSACTRTTRRLLVPWPTPNNFLHRLQLPFPPPTHTHTHLSLISSHLIHIHTYLHLHQPPLIRCRPLHPSSSAVMSQYYYGSQHHQPSSSSSHSSASSHGHHGGRSRRAARLSASQNSHRQFRGVRSMKELAESPPVSAFRIRFEAGRSFDLDDDLEFCPGLLTEDDVRMPCSS